MILSLENISLNFGGIKAVDQVSLDIEEGEIFALIGPNGAGKSTMFNIVSRYYTQSNGSIIYQNKSIDKLHPHQLSKIGVARTFQNIELFPNSTVLQNLLVGQNSSKTSNFLQEMLFLPSVRKAEIDRRIIVEEVIDFLNLQPFRDKQISALSYGTRKVVELGRALTMQPHLLLLDEPASGLSAEETTDLAFWIEDIKKIMGITVLMVEHDLNLVGKVADRVGALVEGKLVAVGSLKEIQANKEVVEAYIGA
ncbi:ABC transporter ATP-binding protein [Paracoccaceae bacterium]|nr:ABC transporter ATP-binding protein [Paracoccaceae bacterium]